MPWGLPWTVCSPRANFGIITKMGFWLMPEPEAYLSATVFVPRHLDLVPLVDAVNYLENSAITNGNSGVVFTGHENGPGGWGNTQSGTPGAHRPGDPGQCRRPRCLRAEQGTPRLEL